MFLLLLARNVHSLHVQNEMSLNADCRGCLAQDFRSMCRGVWTWSCLIFSLLQKFQDSILLVSLHWLAAAYPCLRKYLKMCCFIPVFPSFLWNSRIQKSALQGNKQTNKQDYKSIKNKLQSSTVSIKNYPLGIAYSLKIQLQSTGKHFSSLSERVNAFHKYG